MMPESKQPRGPKSMLVSQREIFDLNMGAFAALASFAEDRGVDVINCNPKSKVKAFKRMAFSEATEGG